jgi:4-hydroxy-3-methylbut-2-enyl diphosphate reductase IspH
MLFVSLRHCIGSTESGFSQRLYEFSSKNGVFIYHI